MDLHAQSVESSEQLAAVWRRAVLDRDAAADVRDLPGLAVRWAESGFPFWNCVALTERGADAELLARRLDGAAAVMRMKRRPGFLWLFEHLLDGSARAALEPAAERAGLRHAFSGAGMAGDVLPLPEPAHRDLTFARVRTEEQLAAYADLNARAYGFPPQDVRDGLSGSALWTDGAYAYLALREGEPVACAGAVEEAGRLFVALVATDPRWQRRGYGEAVTRKALYEASRATGLTRAVLHATEAGAPVYRRIGLAPNSPIRFYALGD
ncbi:GNAT family N-acetyltransferase [Streptomyces sp. NPDC002490]|uniref:GNAT family N-acetyltransferase n=1 Tax=Streptomyces sp. NPDC002490 TaxID=3154416 RepID=UPI00332A70B3